ncbi:kinase-like domain-containing protein [Achaetomium macrosporum]|uniref:non-specific serine/threonine protein kinase n=1 Tax=Achaetomium macrosporum TaxID=79813 RepID=A0AAN7C7K0_9PEZI|nr:kinase-like domain-containing protein [Achaetomium macrosporum]
MSLVPYHPREGREIVLRHHNAIVVRDPSSQRLEIRGLQLHECPTCHQPLRSASPDRHFESTHHGESYVDPDYFRMLHAGHNAQSATQPRPPASPIRRLVEPILHDEGAAADGFVSGSPAPQGGGRIKPEAFSQNYFNTFFIEEKELGRGGKGVVLLVRHEIDGCNLGHFACKRVPVGDDHAWLEKVLVEVELLAKLAHPNLVSYRHVWLEDVQLTRFGPSVACAFILQQYCNGGDLLHYVIGDVPREARTKEELKAQMRRKSKGQAERPQFQKRLPPEEIYSLFKDVTSGLAYLHAANYIHRDLKPSNCLLHRDGNQLKCLISDFGEVQPEDAVRKSTGSTGTISYCAPEVLKRDTSGRYGNFTTKSDIFSLGLILYFMCFGRLPYDNANTAHEELEDIDQLRAEISDWKGFQDERRERPDLPSKLYHLLKRLLAVNPAERPTASEVLGAMGADSNLDGMMRGSRNTSSLFGLSGQRIQNLDSPMPPSTPIGDPSKRARVNSAIDDDLPAPFNRASPDPRPQPTSSSTLLARRITPPSPRTATHHQDDATSHAMTLTRSHRGSGGNHPRRSPSHSPQRSPTLESVSESATITTPLLMPPPTTRGERARQAAALAWYRAAEWVTRNTALLRLVLFGLKILSLSWVCWPYSAEWGFVAGVVALAALDLHSDSDGLDSSWVRRRPWTRGQGQEHEGLAGGGVSRWIAGWRRSLVLLLMHCAVMGAASRFGMLCAGGGERRLWEEW